LVSRVHRVALRPLAVLCVFTIGARDGCRSHLLEDRGDALAAADAHGDEGVPAGCPPQLI
jgi:hypothetical protein